ncbi:MAG: MmcB family DNA repair protein [Endomicrobium sp.]|jgi:hypothetical protein|nr:MmcB family DNA repair protein [Endomicrobium sp.]
MNDNKLLSANEIKIRSIDWLLEENKNAILSNELLFSKNKRRADIVMLLENQVISFEIKGDLDNVKNLQQQLKDYLRTFDKVNIICTNKLFNRIYNLVPKRVGIVLFDKEFKIIRSAKINKKLSKNSLIQFCKYNVLLKFLNKNQKHLSTEEMRIIVAKKLALNSVKELSYQSLTRKITPLYKIFLKDRGKFTIKEDLLNLAGEIKAIR